MDEKITYTASILLGAAALVLLVANVSLVNGNRHQQEAIAQRQNVISSGANLSQLNQSLVQALADAAIRDADGDLRALLAAQGITVKENAAKTAAPAAPAKAK